MTLQRPSAAPQLPQSSHWGYLTALELSTPFSHAWGGLAVVGWGLMSPALGLEQEMPVCWGMWTLQDGREGMQSTLHRVLTSMSKWKGMGKEGASVPVFSTQSCSPQSFISSCLSSVDNNLLPPSLFSALQVSKRLMPLGHQEQRICTVTIHSLARGVFSFPKPCSLGWQRGVALGMSQVPKPCPRLRAQGRQTDKTHRTA